MAFIGQSGGAIMAARLSRSLLRSKAVSCRVPAAASSFGRPRSYANAARNPDEMLKSDFRRWLRKEVVVLAVMVATGVTGVHFYQNRESSPVKQVERLVEQAEQSAKEGNSEQALRHCLQAYDVIKSTNPHDRHLFELAFSIAAQYEALEKDTPATTYYLDALEHNKHELNVARRERNRVVTLDRLAQSYENRGQLKTAERYFKQAIATYDQNRGRRELSKSSKTEATDLVALDQEIPGVLYNYSQLLMAQQRWRDAGKTLQRAMTLARVSGLSDEYTSLIEDSISRVKKANSTAEAGLEQDAK